MGLRGMIGLFLEQYAKQNFIDHNLNNILNLTLLVRAFRGDQSTNHAQ